MTTEVSQSTAMAHFNSVIQRIILSGSVVGRNTDWFLYYYFQCYLSRINFLYMSGIHTQIYMVKLN